jgi:peptide/nickel transport system permease protein
VLPEPRATGMPELTGGMPILSQPATAMPRPRRGVGQFALAWARYRRHKLAVVGAAFFITMVAAAVIGPIVDPFNSSFVPGVTRPGGDPPSLHHIFGTDAGGRDVFTMVLDGAHISLLIGVGSALIAGIIGVGIGVMSGYVGGRLDGLLMRVVDVFFAVPLLFVILFASRFFGQGQVLPITVIFGALSWPLIARLVRASYLELRGANFVEAAHAVGVSHIRIALRDMLPNVLGPVIVAMTLTTAKNIVLEAFVSYLNFGISATTVTWGNALSDAQNYLSLGNWWWPFFPGMAIACTALALNFIGDGLNDALNPRELVVRTRP